MKLSLLFAWRYLFARKSHNVINVISAISAVGMAVGTAALILILSVYNGFDRIIEENISDLDPDLRVQAASGKFFDPQPVLTAVGSAHWTEGACPEKRLAPLDPISACADSSPFQARPSQQAGPLPLEPRAASLAGRNCLSPAETDNGMSQSDRGLRSTAAATAAGTAVATATAVLEDDVFLSYGDEQTIVRARGVPDNYISDGILASHLREGSPTLRKGDIPYACVGSGVAGHLGLSPRFVEKMRLYYPDRNTVISLSNPASSMCETDVFPSGTFSISSDIDNSLIIIPIDVMQELLHENGASAVEIRLADSKPRQIERYRRILTGELGPGYIVQNRYQMHPALFRMMKIEKTAIFLILLFVVIIVAFNIFGSLSMLVIEKQDDMEMIRAMGGSEKLVRDIFRLEGWLISLLGLSAGLVFGIGLTLLQQYFGLVRMPGNFLIEAYPVELQAGDVLLTAAGVALVGFLISLLAAPAKRCIPAGRAKN